MTHHQDRLLLPAGTELFTEGEAGEVAYLIQSGRVQIYLNRDGRELPLVVRGPGEIVGEIAIIDNRPRSASARVVEDCELMIVTAEQLRHRLQSTDPILRMCLGVAIDRYRETVALLNHGNVSAPIRNEGSAASPDFQAAVEALVLDRELRRALERSEFELFYQPIVRLRSRKLAGFEALCRWRHPERGLVSPALFIPAAEASGLIVDLTQWAIGAVARALPELMLAALTNTPGVEPLFLSVNISGRDLAQPAFAEMVATTFKVAGINPASIKLEVTESMLMNDTRQASAMLAACRDQGMGIAIDDFGTGYSSLSYLSTLPITTLKVDRAFVCAMTTDPTSRRIVQTILRLADELGIPVVAEGIEHESEADTLTDMGCEYGQGYAFARPMPLDQALALTRGWGASARPAALPSRAREQAVG